MDISASYTFSAPPETVWALLNDPAVIAACLPGCEGLESIGEDRYRATLTLAIAAISGRYTGTVAMLDKDPPHSYRLVVEGNGKAGFIKGEATFELVPEDGGTLVNVSGRGEVGGLIARVGQRLIGGMTKTMTDRFFACLQSKANSLTRLAKRGTLRQAGETVPAVPERVDWQRGRGHVPLRRTERRRRAGAHQRSDPTHGRVGGRTRRHQRDPAARPARSRQPGSLRRADHCALFGHSHGLHALRDRCRLRDRDGRVLKIVRDLRPWRIAGLLRAYAVIEVPGGSLRRSDVAVGDHRN